MHLPAPTPKGAEGLQRLEAAKRPESEWLQQTVVYRNEELSTRKVRATFYQVEAAVPKPCSCRGDKPCRWYLLITASDAAPVCTLCQKRRFYSGSALAASKIGEFSASGFIFKDSVEAVAVEDPDGTVSASLSSISRYKATGILSQCHASCLMSHHPCSQRSHHIHLRLQKIHLRQTQ